MRKPVWSGLVLCALLGCSGPKSSTGGEAPQPSPSAESPTAAPVEAPPAEPRAPADAAATPKPLQVTASPASKDDIIIKGVELQGDTLVVRVMHGGGCKEHTYELLWNGSFQKSAAGEAQAELVLAHDANGDSCEALLNRTASFELGPLKQRWREQNKSEHGAVELRFAGSQVTGRYTF
ncbi:hypothetical protein [Archangium lansingense]|uniref:NigD-like C-terminal domain-containing protein n=1 Tax=Archangium lansingense TaxID=2995310 RepID=A0ABT3ZZC8_9BACT|nr:hypothetical protein [Archangium lansinium]MCY1074763.1 hypothetical protein [Archangium lansinium]